MAKPATPAEERFWPKVAIPADVITGCWLWTATLRPDGYGSFWPTGKAHVPPHRFAYEAVRGSVPTGMVLDHLCRVPRCVNPAHLEPVTRGENVRRGLCTGGTWTRGEGSGMARLTWAQAVEIRERYAAGGYTHRSLAAAYGVGHSVIGSIVRGRAWLPPTSP